MKNLLFQQKIPIDLNLNNFYLISTLEHPDYICDNFYLFPYKYLNNFYKIANKNINIMFHLLKMISPKYEIFIILKMKNLFVECGGTIDFTDEELIFSALHHDLGKLGTKDFLHYVKNDSDWHIKNKGEYFKRNEEIPYS